MTFDSDTLLRDIHRYLQQPKTPFKLSGVLPQFSSCMEPGLTLQPAVPCPPFWSRCISLFGRQELK
jgi:hypothetical protein